MKKKKIAVFLIIFIMLSTVSFTVAADYYSDSGYQGSPKLFEVAGEISDFTKIGSLTSPSDLFIDEKNELYILDSGNSRILVFDRSGKYLRSYSGSYGAEAKPMNKPLGLYVNGNDIYVADTDNQRVLHIGKDGNFIEEFTQPKEDTFDTEYPFRPNKIVVDHMGIMYIANLTDYHGLITMNGENTFLGYISSSKIELSLQEKLVRIFATAEMKAQYAREVPPYFSNITIGLDGFIYGVSNWAYKNQIKKLTAAGNNIYPDGYYGTSNEYEDYNKVPGLGDIAVDSKGFVYVADTENKKVCVFDQDGNNISVFGGEGVVAGKFNSITSIAVDSGDRLYVLDGSTGIIQIFEQTKLMREISNASYLTNSGQYDEAVPYWENVKKYDDLQYLANLGIAKAKYRSGEYKEAMKIYKEQYSTGGYSQVFSDYRMLVFRNNFILVCFIFLAVLAGTIFAVKKLYVYANKISVQPIPMNSNTDLPMYGRFALLMLFHPIDAFDKIKQNRNRLKIWPIFAMILLIGITRIANLYIVHFPLTNMNLVYADLWQQVATFFVPLLSWVIAGYALTVVSDGKQTLVECLTTSFMCFIPYVLFSYPLGAISHIMCSSEAGLFHALSVGLIAWSIALLMVSSMRMNEYTFGKVLWMALKTAFVVLCLWMIVFLFGVIIYQFVDFIKAVYFESTFVFM